ncbi:FAD-dependent oxidoreductase [Paraburkholderia sediminicola]|uniref:FAD-dependent oxidoreductase n=1 Tax=Paraburkholderia sediminicola TaxID=458836 RepID=UPI0038B8EEAD
MSRIAIIGAGITGVTTAHALAQRGHCAEGLALDAHTRRPAAAQSNAHVAQVFVDG